MIVYADREERVSTRHFIQELRLASDPLERLIRIGQLEAAIVDEICPEQDEETAASIHLRGVACGRIGTDCLEQVPLPDEVTIKTPEGYALYSLYPEQYEIAVDSFVAEAKPRDTVVIGIRSIGTSLSSVVVKRLEEHGLEPWSFTVRPHGHPYARVLRMAPPLESQIQQRRNGTMFCVVDEGPGISGSSFAAVAEKLSALGIPDRQIIFFPSHLPNIANLRSENARRVWSRHRIYVEPFRPERHVPQQSIDLSGGLWREVVRSYPAVQPQHERRKYLHEERLWKFSGLAHFGRRRFERAQRLAQERFSPDAVEFRDGFIVFQWHTSGEPLSADGSVDFIARYLSFLRREFSTGGGVRYADLVHMIHANTGQECAGTDPLVEDQEVVAIDGRMLPHEWAGALKTDSVDHHDDHFFPGCQDIAWDVAGAAVEFGLPAGAIARRYLQLTPDATLLRRLPFYTKAYLAYRIGYSNMAAESLGESPDGQRFRDLAGRYTAALLVATATPASSAT